MPAGATQEPRDPFALGQLLAVGIAIILGMAVDGVFGINRTPWSVALKEGLACLHATRANQRLGSRKPPSRTREVRGHESCPTEQCDAMG
jgi:hypothetical protein